MKKPGWLILSCLIVLVLILVSCGQTTTQTPSTPTSTKANMVKLTLTKLDGTKITKTVEKPKYGGTIVTSCPQSTENLYPGQTASFTEPALQYNVYETMTIADWTRGPAGTNEDPGFDNRVEDMYWIPLAGGELRDAQPQYSCLSPSQRDSLSEQPVFSLQETENPGDFIG